MSHPSAVRLIPDCRVSVDGKKLDIETDAGLTKVEVDLDIDLFGQCVLVFNDPAQKLINGKQFQSGTAVKVELGFASKLKKVFEGEVVALEPQFRRDMPTSLRVVCLDSLHRLALSQMTRSFNDVDDKEIVGKIATAHGLTGDAPTSSKQHVLQGNITDATFLRRLTQKHGNHLRIEGKKLIVGPPHRGADLTLGPSDGLRKVKVRIQSADQVEEISVHGYDPSTKREFVGKAKGQGESGEGSRKYGKGKTLSFAGHDEQPKDQATAEAMAKGRMRKLAQGHVIAHVDSIGDPGMLPGATVNLEKMGAQIDGSYRVDKARHQFSKDGYFVNLKAVRVSKKTPAAKAQDKQAKAEQKQRQAAADDDRSRREDKRTRDRNRERQGAPKEKGPFAQKDTEFSASVSGEPQGDLVEAEVSGEPESEHADAEVSGEPQAEHADAEVSADEQVPAGAEPEAAPDGGDAAAGAEDKKTGDEGDEAAPESTEPEAETDEPEEETTAVAPPSVVATLEGVHFEFDKSFALPGAIPTWRGVLAFLKKEPTRSVLVVGHTDRKGDADYNLALSKERAEIAAAALRGDTSVWCAHYDHKEASKKWGAREDGWMLHALGFLAKEPKDASAVEIKAAVLSVQRKHTLDGNGEPTPATRKALVQQYLDLRGTSNIAVSSAVVLACGDRHPKEGASDKELRRVEIYLFDGEVKPAADACRNAKHPGCTAYAAWRKEVTGDVPPEAIPPGPQSTPDDDPVKKAQVKVDALKKKNPVRVVSRSTWGARPRNPDDKEWVDYPASAPLPLTNIVVHHTSGVKFFNGGLNLTVKDLQDYEMDSRHFSDLPYHFVITADGTIHEGRELKSMGAHAGEIEGNKDPKLDPDWGSVGIVLTGNFEDGSEVPTAAQLKSLHDLTCHLLLEYDGIDLGHILKHREVKRSGKPTVCPGARMVAKVDELKASPDLREIEDALKELRDAKNGR